MSVMSNPVSVQTPYAVERVDEYHVTPKFIGEAETVADAMELAARDSEKRQCKGTYFARGRGLPVHIITFRRHHEYVAVSRDPNKPVDVDWSRFEEVA